MKKVLKFGVVIFVIGTFMAIIGAAFHGIKAIEFNGLHVRIAKEAKTIRKTYTSKEFSSLEVISPDFLPAKVKISQGDDYSVSYHGNALYEPKLRYQEGKLSINQSYADSYGRIDLTGNYPTSYGELTITVPKDKTLSELTVNGQGLDMFINDIKTDKLVLDVNTAEDVSLTNVEAKKTDLTLDSDGVSLNNTHLADGSLSITDGDLKVTRGELTNITVHSVGEGDVTYNDGLILNGGSTHLEPEEDDDDENGDLSATRVTVQGKYEMESVNGEIWVTNANAQGYRLTSTKGKNTLFERSQRNGGTLEENSDQTDVLNITNHLGDNTVK